MAGIREQIIQAGLQPPRAVTMMVTNGCNLQCQHCWPDSGPHPSIRPVHLDTLKRLIQELTQLPVEEICLSGGEPFTHPHWFEVVRYACHQPGVKRVSIQTNAILLGPAEIRALGTLDFQGLCLQVSLDGARSSTHDQIRGNGSFEKTMQGLRRLVDAGLGKQIRLAFTEMEHNIADLPRLLALADQLGVSGVISGTLVQQGRAVQHQHFRLPTPRQYTDLLNRYHEDSNFRSRYCKLGNIAALEWLAGRINPTPETCICIETPYIDADGQVFPCIMLSAAPFAVQGAHARSLVDMLREAIPLWAALPKLTRRRREELPVCQACPGKLHCAGGCVGRAYAATGDLLSPEDRCALRKAVYQWDEPSS